MAEIRKNREYDMLDGETVQICKKAKFSHNRPRWPKGFRVG
jgi:hypothetical protein